MDDLFVDPLSLAVGEVDSLGGYWQAVYTTQMFDFGFRTGVQRSEFARAYYASEMQDGAQGAIYADLDMEATNALGELTVDMRLGAQWQIGIAAQVMNAKRAIDNRETGDSINQDRWSFTPKAGIIYGRNKMWHAYANVSVSQEMPSFWELAANKTNPLPPQDHQVVLSDLKVQQAITVEAGIAGEWLPGHHGQLTIYRTRLEDELLSTAGSTGLIDDTINYDATSIHQGMELGASGDVRFTSLLGLTYRLSYVFSDFYFSGHTGHTLLLAMEIYELGLPLWTKILINIQLVYMAIMLIASRTHYSIDIVGGLIFGQFAYYISRRIIYYSDYAWSLPNLAYRKCKKRCSPE